MWLSLLGICICIMRLLSVSVWLLHTVIEIMSFWPFKIVIFTSNEYKKGIIYIWALIFMLHLLIVLQ
jgi:hypothetical protein